MLILNVANRSYSKLMFKVSLPKTSPCPSGSRWMTFGAKVLGYRRQTVVHAERPAAHENNSL